MYLVNGGIFKDRNNGEDVRWSKGLFGGVLGV